MQYAVRHVVALDLPDADWDRPQWQQADTLEVGLFPWPDSGHHPATTARLLYDDQRLGIIFRVEDHYVRAVSTRFQDMVCQDSCVEFFVAPLPESDAYFNFEVNCGGVMLVYRCPSSAETASGERSRQVTDGDGSAIAMAHSMPRTVEPEVAEPTVWTVEYHVPFALFGQYFGAQAPVAGAAWRGNFYKCGDRTSHPHWGSWAPVDVPRPNFHQPAFFQPIVFA